MRRGAYQVLGFFGSLAQPRDAAATYEEEPPQALPFERLSALISEALFDLIDASGVKSLDLYDLRWLSCFYPESNAP